MEEHMKLYNAYYICKNNLAEVLNAQFKSLSSTQGEIYDIESWGTLVESLIRIKDIPYLTDAVINVYESVPILLREKIRPRISASDHTKIAQCLSKLGIKMQTIIDLYETIDTEERSAGIDVRIPDHTDLKQYVRYLDNINFIFTQCPCLIAQEEQIQFRGTDVGSMWLTFAIVGTASTAILLNLAKLIDSAVVIKSHLITCRQQQQVLDSMETRAGMASDIKELFEEMKDKILNSEMEKILNGQPEPDPEEQDKLKRSLDLMANLLDKGVQIYSSIDSPKDVQAVFPAIEQQEVLTGASLKLIEDKKEV